MLQPGQRAPRFSLVGATGDSIDRHRLTEYTDNGWTVVLLFYPFDFHPVCADQLCSVGDADWLSTLEDVVVLGIGTDSAYSHRAFALAHDIGYTLLSDGDGSVARAYGVLTDEHEGHRIVARSALYVVEPDRRIRHVWVGDGVEDRPNLEAVEGVIERDRDEVHGEDGTG